MAMPSRITMQLAKAYANQILKDKTPDQARHYLNTKFGRIPQTQIDEAIAQAKLAIDIGDRLSRLPASSLVKDALGGHVPPASTVGVRVVIVRTAKDGSVYINSPYIDVTWDSTVKDIMDAILDWVKNNKDSPKVAEKVDWYIRGPTLWPVS